jgi:DNA-binding MarR family transcriptional regulator
MTTKSSASATENSGKQLDPVAEATRQWRAHGFKALPHMEATANVSRLAQLIQRAMEETLRPLNLTRPQHEALALLNFSHDGCLPLGKMSRRLTVHATTVTSTVDQLESKGFVERTTSDKDRRQIIARITPLGRETAVKAADAMGEIKYGLAGMSVAEAKEIAGMIRQFRATIPDLIP